MVAEKILRELSYAVRQSVSQTQIILAIILAALSVLIYRCWGGQIIMFEKAPDLLVALASLGVVWLVLFAFHFVRASLVFKIEDMKGAAASIIPISDNIKQLISDLGVLLELVNNWTERGSSSNALFPRNDAWDVYQRLKKMGKNPLVDQVIKKEIKVYLGAFHAQDSMQAIPVSPRILKTIFQDKEQAKAAAPQMQELCGRIAVKLREANYDFA